MFVHCKIMRQTTNTRHFKRMPLCTLRIQRLVGTQHISSSHYSELNRENLKWNRQTFTKEINENWLHAFDSINMLNVEWEWNWMESHWFQALCTTWCWKWQIIIIIIICRSVHVTCEHEEELRIILCVPNSTSNWYSIKKTIWSTYSS